MPFAGSLWHKDKTLILLQSEIINFSGGEESRHWEGTVRQLRAAVQEQTQPEETPGQLHCPLSKHAMILYCTVMREYKYILTENNISLSVRARKYKSSVCPGPPIGLELSLIDASDI